MILYTTSMVVHIIKKDCVIEHEIDSPVLFFDFFSRCHHFVYFFIAIAIPTDLDFSPRSPANRIEISDDKRKIFPFPTYYSVA